MGMPVGAMKSGTHSCIYAALYRHVDVYTAVWRRTMYEVLILTRFYHLGGGFKHFFQLLPGEMIQLDEHISYYSVI